GAVVLGPRGDAEGRLLLDGEVVPHVDERGGDVTGDVRRPAAGEVDGPVVVVLEVEDVAAAGARAVEELDLFRNLDALASPEVDAVVVVVLRPEHALAFPGRVVDPDGPACAVDDADLLGEFIAEPDESAVVEVPDGEVVPVPIAWRLELLLGDDVDVRGVPDLDACALLRLSCRCGIGGLLLFLPLPLLDPEEDGL